MQFGHITKLWIKKILTTILGDTLYANQSQLNRGDYLQSKNRCYKLSLQNDGNLLMTNQHTEELIWSSGTSDKVNSFLSK